MAIKAFELVEVIANVQLLGEKSHSKIECIECCGKELYLGTSDGWIILYILEENHQLDGSVTFISKRERSKQLDSKKPIVSMKAASAINRLLVQCETVIHILFMTELKLSNSSIRGVSTFCVNENPNVNNPFCTQICCALLGKRRLQVFNVTEEHVIHVKDVNMSEPATSLGLDGNNVCVALNTQYAVYNFQNDTTQRLFPCNNLGVSPIIRRITKDEFLVSGPENLGMFVTAAGVSNRPPVQWSSRIEGLAYLHPYVLGASPDSIVVYSILDQQSKQVINVHGAKTIGNFDGRVYLNSGAAVFELRPVPWQTQVEVLLTNGEVEEALNLASNITPAGISRDQFHQIYQKIQQRAGFVYFARRDYEKASELFITGAVDVCEVISIFPGLLPACSGFVRSSPPLHGIADINQLHRADEEAIKEAYDFLLRFLNDVRPAALLMHRAMEVDTALVKLFSKSSPSELEAFVASGNIHCDIKDCHHCLEKNNCNHSLALLYKNSNDNETALKIWSKIISNELTDERFPGIGFIVDCLAKSQEPDLVWRYADFVLSTDEELGVGIFTHRSQSESNDLLKQDEIIEFLHRYPVAMVKYLEYLVLEKQVPTEKLHTNLAVLYLDEVLRLQKNDDEEATLKARTTLRNLLLQSSLYRVQLLLGRMQEAELYQEVAILYGKMELHDKALDILVHRLKDFKIAEEYCVNTKNNSSSQNVFHLLLSTYLDPTLIPTTRDEYLAPALNLLNSRATEFDAAQVLKIIPTSWPINVIESFIRSALRGSLHKYRMSKMTASLARGENLQKKYTLYGLEKHSVPLNLTNYCCVCKKPFSDMSFARYPNNVLIHPSCVRHNTICPITGQNFQAIGSSCTER